MTYVPHNHSEDGSEIDMSVESVMMCNNTGSYHPDVALASFADGASDHSSDSNASDDDNSEPRPMAAYAPPAVYGTPTGGTTMDYDFTSDDNDMSFAYLSPSADDNSDDESFTPT